ncbi:MAG: V-type ATP synthase subunit D [Thermoprotei archaeon]|nr:MAG: V-type ATP synthase subunit D [Thermoprotei archaeon]
MSSAKTLKVRPTKIELIKLKRRRILAKRIHRILRERLTILVAEFLSIARGAVKKREELYQHFSKAYEAMSIAYGFHGRAFLTKEMLGVERDVEVVFGTQNIMGVKVPLLEPVDIERKLSERGYVLTDTSLYIDEASRRFEEALKLSIELAEVEKTLERLGMEIRKMRRRVNVLEHILIPKIEATIKYLSMKFEEREREERARLKRVKVLLARRRGK